MSYDKEIKYTLGKTDVLIVGGGFGGLWAAVKAAESSDLTVTLVDNSSAGMGGHSFLSSGAMIVLEPDDELEDWANDIVSVNDGLADRKVIEAILSESYDRLKDFEALGVDFPKDNGEYARIPSRGAKTVKLIGGPEGGAPAMTLALRREALKRGVKIINKLFISDLLTNGQGRIVGAIGINRITGDYYVFNTKAVVLATNSGGFKGQHLASDQQGTGVFMAYEAGAELKNAEFHYINIRPTRFEIEGSGIFPAFGARWINAAGEYFMDKYDPVLKDRASHHLVLTAMALEARAGKAPIAIDTPSLTAEGRKGFQNTMIRHGWMPVLYHKLKRNGLDFLQEKVEWKPAYESNRVGVFADIHCKAKGVEGLFAAGMARSFDPNPLTGWSIACCVWSGHMAGKQAASFAFNSKEETLDFNQINQLSEKLLTPLKRGKGISPDEVVKKLQEILFPADVLILMREDKIREALAKVETVKDDLAPTMTANDIHEVIKVREAETMVLAAEMSLRAALLRTESRPKIFFREDYPQIDNDNWLQWIVVKKSGNEISFRKTKLTNCDTGGGENDNKGTGCKASS